jgi:hypothetical protein
MLIKKILPGFYNGVSQQPASTRLDTQCEAEENMYGTLVDGLIRRPNTEFITTLSSHASSNAFFHTINRDENEKYIMVITDDKEEPIEIYTLNGTRCTVNYSDATAKSYCITTNPKTSLRAVTIADYTILANTTVKCLKNTSWTVPVDYSAEYFVFVKRGVIRTTYNIFYTNPAGQQHTISTYTTDDSTTSTETIAQGILNNLTTVTTTTYDTDGNPITTTSANPAWTALQSAGWVISRLGSTIRIYNRNTAGATLGTFSATDGYGNTALTCTNKTMSSFSDLWALPWVNKLFTITGDTNNDFTKYYVKTLDKDGTWVETVRTDINNKVEASTLPHQIIRSAENTFTVSTIDWQDRTIGDENSAPDPSFIGDYIKGVFFLQNRLGFLAGENVILSKAADYFNLYPTTALDILDDDPIDVAVSTTQVNILHSAISFNENLLLDSTQQQFILTAGDNLLTPKTVQTLPITRYITSSKCLPVAAGTNLYYVAPNGNYSNIKEYFVQPDTSIPDAEDITQHVDRYIPSNITDLVSCIPANMLFAFSINSPNTLYQYSYLWQGNNKIQSAWTKWTFDDDILGLTTLDSNLYLLIKKDGSSEICLVKMDLTHATTGSLPFRVYLDKLTSIQGTYNNQTKVTTWTLPYHDSTNNFNVIDSVTGLVVSTVSKNSDNTIIVTGDYSSIPYFIGKTYNSTYQFSEWFNKANDDKVGDLEGRLQLKKLILHFEDTGPFTISITPYRRETITSIYSGFIIGQTYFDAPILASDTKSVLMMCNSRNTKIILSTNSYLPTKFILAEFIGNYVTSARLI